MDTNSSSNGQICGGQPSLHPPGLSLTTSSSSPSFPDVLSPMTPYHSPAPSNEPTTMAHNNRHLSFIIPPSCPCVPVNIPSFEEMADPDFVCGTLDGTAVSVISDCYDLAVHCRPKLFRLPTGRVGELFIKELSRLFSNYANGLSLEAFAFKAAIAFLFLHLILQRTSAKLRVKSIASHIDHRHSLWHQDACLLRSPHEGQSIQSHLPIRSLPLKVDQLPRDFANLMMEVKSGFALRLLTNKSNGHVLSLESPANPADPS